MNTRICITCKQRKPLTDYHLNGWYTRQDGTRGQSYKSDCKPCANQKWKERRTQALLDVGIVWKCVRCGYDKCEDAIDLHHVDPSQKDFAISSRWSVSAIKLKAEVDKCVILCANCHRELHADVWKLDELVP